MKFRENPLGLLFFRVRLRRDRNSSASRFRALLSLPLLRLCSTSGAPGFEVSRAHRFGGSRGREAEGSLPMCSLGTENPPGSGWVWCSYESRRQAVDDDSSTRRSRWSVASVARLRALLRSSGGMCIKSLSGISLRIQKALSGPQPRHSLALCGHPSEKRLRLDAREKLPHLTGSTTGGQPAGFVVSVVVFPTPLGLPPPNVEPILL